jgi:hypothetical protein
VECCFEENADVVGAINILRAGDARFACEVSDAARSPAAGTHRSDSVQRAALSAPQESPAFRPGRMSMKGMLRGGTPMQYGENSLNVASARLLLCYFGKIISEFL